MVESGLEKDDQEKMVGEIKKKKMEMIEQDLSNKRVKSEQME